jgi:hypothetical protein
MHNLPRDLHDHKAIEATGFFDLKYKEQACKKPIGGKKEALALISPFFPDCDNVDMVLKKAIPKGKGKRYSVPVGKCLFSLLLILWRANRAIIDNRKEKGNFSISKSILNEFLLKNNACSGSAKDALKRDPCESLNKFFKVVLGIESCILKDGTSLILTDEFIDALRPITSPDNISTSGDRVKPNKRYKSPIASIKGSHREKPYKPLGTFEKERNINDNSAIPATLQDPLIINGVNKPVKDTFDDSGNLLNEVISYFGELEKFLISLPAYYPDDLHFDKVCIPVNIKELAPFIIKVNSSSRPEESDDSSHDLYHFPVRGSIFIYKPNRSTPLPNRVFEWNTYWGHGEQGRRIVIVADPGMGKSFLLKYQCLKYLKISLNVLLNHPENLDTVTLPIFLRLPDLAVYFKRHCNSSMEEAISEKLSEHFSPKGFSEDFFCYLRKKIDSDKSVIFLDALDEMSEEDRVDVRNRIGSFSKKFSKCSILLNSRKAEYYSPPPLQEGKEIEILPLNIQQIKEFITSWFSARTDDNERCNIIDRKMFIELQRNSELMSMCQNPLFLSFFCRLWEEEKTAPLHNKAELYYEIISGLIVHWKKLKLSKPLERTIIRDKLKVIERLAWRLFQEGKEDIRQEELDDYIFNILRDTTVSLPGLEGWKAMELRKELLQDGIITEIGSAESAAYNFTHRTFRDYFIASLISRNQEYLNEIKDNFWFFPRWHHIITMLAGFAQGKQSAPDSIRSPVDTDVTFEPLEFLSAMLEFPAYTDDIFHSRLTIAAECISELPFHLRDSEICKNIDKLVLSESESPENSFLFESKAKLAVNSKSIQQFINIIVKLLFFEQAQGEVAKNQARIFARILLLQFETDYAEIENTIREFAISKHYRGRELAAFLYGEIALSKPDSCDECLNQLFSMLDDWEGFVSHEAAEALGEIAVAYPEKTEMIILRLTASTINEDSRMKKISESLIKASEKSCDKEKTSTLEKSTIISGSEGEEIWYSQIVVLRLMLNYNKVPTTFRAYELSLDSVYGSSKALVTIANSSRESARTVLSHIIMLIERCTVHTPGITNLFEFLICFEYKNFVRNETWVCRWMAINIMRQISLKYSDINEMLLPFFSDSLKEAHYLIYCTTTLMLGDMAVQFPYRVDEIQDLLFKSLEDENLAEKAHKYLIFPGIAINSDDTAASALKRIAIQYPARAESIVNKLFDCLQRKFLHYLHWNIAMDLSDIANAAPAMKPCIDQNLKELIKNDAYENKIALAVALARIDESDDTVEIIAPYLIKGLRYNSESTKFSGMFEIEKRLTDIKFSRSESAKGYVSNLLNSLDDNQFPGTWVVKILGGILTEHPELKPEIFPRLIEIFEKDGDKAAAAEVLGNIAVKVSEWSPEIISILREHLYKNGKTNQGAGEALIEIFLADSGKTSEIIPLIKEMAQKEQCSIPRWTIKYLERIQNSIPESIEDVIKILLEALDENDREFTSEILIHLRNLCSRHKIIIIKIAHMYMKIQQNDDSIYYITQKGNNYKIIGSDRLSVSLAIRTTHS